MFILGYGVDIVDNRRIAKSIKNNLFISRIFTNFEINQSKKIKNKVGFYAKRFAAKEAFVKALGSGFRNINFKDINIKNNAKGKPFINLSNNLKDILKKKFKINEYKIFLSMSDEKNHSIAFVIFNKIR